MSFRWLSQIQTPPYPTLDPRGEEKRKWLYSRGFTILELMVVIAMMAILMAIALPSYHTYLRRAHFMEVIQATLPYKLGVETCFQMEGNLDPCTNHYGDIPNPIPAGQGVGLVSQIEIQSQGIIVATPKERDGFLSSDTYILTPEMVGTQLHWQASGEAVQKGYAHE